MVLDGDEEVGRDDVSGILVLNDDGEAMMEIG